MDARQLEYFVAVAEELSFTRAAQRVFAVQSTVSAAIRALESDLGATLFDRSTRRVVLSSAGSALLPEAKAALDSLERARAVVEEASAGLRGSVRVGTMASIGIVDLAGLFGAFHERHPLVDVQLTVSPTGSTGLADDLRHSRLDVAMLGLPKSDLPGLDVHPLATVPFVAVLPVGHRLAAAPEVNLADLAGERFVDTLPGFGNRVMVDRAFEALSAPRRVGVEVADLTTVPAFVATGLGVAVVPELVAPPPSTVVTRPLAGEPLTWILYTATTAGRQPSRAVAALLELIDSYRSPRTPGVRAWVG